MAGKPFPFNVPVNGRYGAPMGRPNVGNPDDTYIPMTVRRVPIDGQGYDPGGAYWGLRERGMMLFCLWSADRSSVRYVDARSYLFAEETVREEFPQADFLKG